MVRCVVLQNRVIWWWGVLCYRTEWCDGEVCCVTEPSDVMVRCVVLQNRVMWWWGVLWSQNRVMWWWGVLCYRTEWCDGEVCCVTEPSDVMVRCVVLQNWVMWWWGVLCYRTEWCDGEVCCVTELSDVMVRSYFGLEYECPRGHRFFCSGPEKILKSTPGSCPVAVSKVHTAGPDAAHLSLSPVVNGSHSTALSVCVSLLFPLTVVSTTCPLSPATQLQLPSTSPRILPSHWFPTATASLVVSLLSLHPLVRGCFISCCFLSVYLDSSHDYIMLLSLLVSSSPGFLTGRGSYPSVCFPCW